MTAPRPAGAGSQRLAHVMQTLGRRPSCTDAPMERLDCRQPGAPPDLPTTHGLQLASIEARLTKLEQSVSHQNRLLLIGVIALVGELAQKILRP